MSALSDHVRHPLKRDLYATTEISEPLIFVYKIVGVAIDDGADRIVFGAIGISWRPAPPGRRVVTLSYDLRPFVARVLARDAIMRAHLLPIGDDTYRLA